LATAEFAILLEVFLETFLDLAESLPLRLTDALVREWKIERLMLASKLWNRFGE
jgi:hypothetical protein